MHGADTLTRKRFDQLFTLFGKTVETFTKRLVEKKVLRAGITIDNSVAEGNYSLNNCQLNLTKYNGGQETDVTIFAQLYKNACANTSSAKDFILYGASRGAATIYNFIARVYPETEDKRVRVLILEGCFDSISNVSVFSYALPLVAQYKRSGYSPIDPDQVKAFVEICNKEGILVLFVSSDGDKFVPLKNTQRLCDALKEAGLNELYFLILKGPSHPRYMKDVPAEAKRYQMVVHALYAQAGLPHDTVLANLGAEILPTLKL